MTAFLPHIPGGPDSDPPSASEASPEEQGPAAAAAPAGSPDAPGEGGPRRRRRRRRGGRGRGRPGAAAAASGAEPQQPAAPDVMPASGQAPVEVILEPAAEAEADEERAEPVRDAGPEAERATAASVRDDGAPADIDPARLDYDGIKILNRLHRFSHEAYFVGGCVRDLLLGRPPKDFDIATSAHPGEVRSLFRNCRLIGRRFRLAHVFFRGGKIIEVSTFRANPTEGEEGEELPQDLLITRDNVFGTAEQDARRRDFTVNGLFYDIRRGRVIDFVEGMRDHRARLMRTIGNPEVRMREDPVRILRAVRFAARLGFDIDPQTYAAMEGAVEDLPRCAPARLLEETFKLLRGGSSRQCFELLHALGALKLLLPPVADYLARGGAQAEQNLFGRLGALDAKLKERAIDDSVIVAALLAPLAPSAPAAADQETAPSIEVIDTLLEQMVQTARLPRRIADRAKQLMWAKGIVSGERKRRKSLASFRGHPLFSDALMLFELEVAATGQGREVLQKWLSGEAPQLPPEPGQPGSGRRRRRRRRGGRGRRGGPGEAGGPAAPGGPTGSEQQ